MTLRLLPKRAHEWLVRHAFDGGEHGWRCCHTGTPIRFIHVRQPVTGLVGLVTRDIVHYPQCAQCPNEVAIGEPTRSIEQQTLAEASILI